MEQFEEAYKEALATATYKISLDTLEITHPQSPTGDLYVVNYNKDIEAPLASGESNVTFKATAFQFRHPNRNEEGVSDLSFSIDNVNLAITDWLQAVIDETDPIQMNYRAYLLEDLTKPQTKTPISLFVREVSATTTGVTGKARFTDFVNTPFPKETYNRRRFPSLRRL